MFFFYCCSSVCHPLTVTFSNEELLVGYINNLASEAFYLRTDKNKRLTYVFVGSLMGQIYLLVTCFRQ